MKLFSISTVLILIFLHQSRSKSRSFIGFNGVKIKVEDGHVTVNGNGDTVKVSGDTIHVNGNTINLKSYCKPYQNNCGVSFTGDNKNGYLVIGDRDSYSWWPFSKFDDAQIKISEEKCDSCWFSSLKSTEVEQESQNSWWQFWTSPEPGEREKSWWQYWTSRDPEKSWWQYWTSRDPEKSWWQYWTSRDPEKSWWQYWTSRDLEKSWWQFWTSENIQEKSWWQFWKSRKVQKKSWWQFWTSEEYQEKSWWQSLWFNYQEQEVQVYKVLQVIPSKIKKYIG